MLNMKKGLAIVLAAATAFTFAPVASLSSAVSAYAGNPELETSSINLTVGKTTTYTLSKPAGVADDATISISTSNKDVAQASGDNVTWTTVNDTAVTPKWSDVNTNGIAIKAGALGTADGKSATITVKYTNNLGNEITKTLVVNVKAAGVLPQAVKYNGTDKVKLGDTITVRKSASPAAAAVALDDAADGTTFNLAATANPVTTSNDKVVSVTADKKLSYVGVGTATITVNYEVKVPTSNSKAKAGKATFNVTVIPEKSTFKIGNTEITTAQTGSSVVYLTGSNPTKNIGATLADPLPGEKLEYTAYTSTSDTATSATETKDITVSDNGDVTATANAFEQSDKVYFVKVSIKTDATKVAYVKVITSRNEKAFSSLTVNAEGKDYKAESSYNVDITTDGTYKAATNSDAKVALSTADKKSVSLNVTSNSTNGFTVKSSDENTVATSVSGNTVTLTALKPGPATVTIANKADATHYGSATVTLNVTVTTQLLNAKVVAEKSAVTLTKLTKSADLKASVVTTPALAKQPTLKYQFVTKDKDGNYVKAGSTDLTLSDKGTVTYNTTNEGTAIVEIFADATDTYAKPASAYVTVTYTQKQLPTKLSVSTKSLNLEEGASDAIAATGTALSFKSSDEKVATVDATGKVTGVKEGVAVITVSDAGNDEFAAGSADVTVYVTAKAVKPAKVTGVKVSNKKGAKVSVKWTAQNGNVSYRIYKKVGSGKWVAKNVTSNKATLSVKKGAKVTVKVKAFVKGTDGKTVWGPKATSKSFKTDKK